MFEYHRVHSPPWGVYFERYLAAGRFIRKIDFRVEFTMLDTCPDYMLLFFPVLVALMGF